MENMEKKCLVRNSLGECIKWKEMDDGRMIAMFPKAEQRCNPELYKKYKKLVNENKFSVMPDLEDDDDEPIQNKETSKADDKKSQQSNEKSE